MTTKERYTNCIAWFQENMPEAQTELHFTNPFQLMVAVILSAQCTDKRVNMITPALFKRFADPVEMAQATVEDIFEYIKSCSYPNNKAKHLKGMAEGLVNLFAGVVPDDVEQLQKLPGVGRKTANVIASVYFDKPAMAVDTHVFRVAARIGLTKGAKNPMEAEMQLVKNIPESLLSRAHHWLILHGRYVCIARKPACNKCGLTKWCQYFQKQSD